MQLLNTITFVNWHFSFFAPPYSTVNEPVLLHIEVFSLVKTNRKVILKSELDHSVNAESNTIQDNKTYLILLSFKSSEVHIRSYDRKTMTQNNCE